MARKETKNAKVLGMDDARACEAGLRLRAAASVLKSVRRSIQNTTQDSGSRGQGSGFRHQDTISSRIATRVSS